MPEVDIPPNLDEALRLRVEREHVDEETAARELLYQGVEDYVLDLYGEGEISLSKAAELLDTSVHDILRKSRKRGIKPTATEEQVRRSRETAEELL